MNEDFTDAFWFSLDNARKGGKIFKKAEAVRDIPGFYDLMLNTTKWLAKETLAGAASGQILTAKKLYTDLYRDVLSAYTQKQSENLVTMPLGVSRQLRPRITGTAYRKFGHYKMTGKHSFSASGEWHRDGSVLNMHAKWKLNNTYLHTGARFSGNFEKWVNRSTSGTTSAERSVSHSRYRETFNGAEINKRLDEYNRTGVYHYPSAIEPSNVGGVYLGGANKALEGIGQLDGIALDSNNNLVLLGQSGQEIGLPPLRLDDLVTVFRSVYLYGEGPSVTIDPNSKDPENPRCLLVTVKPLKILMWGGFYIRQTG